MKKTTVLHVGSGGVHILGTNGFDADSWQEARLDINPDVKPDIVGDITDMSPEIQGCTFDAVYSSHNLEHLYAHEVSLALREFLRVLKPDGYAIIRCPDIQQVAEQVAQGKLLDTLYTSSAGPITPLDIMFGHGKSIAAGNYYMEHHTAFTLDTLKQACLDAGFGMVDGKAHKGAYGLSVLASVQERPQAMFWSLFNQHVA